MPDRRRFVAHDAVTVSNTAILLIGENKSRVGLIIQETAGQPVRVTNDESDVSTTKGLQLPASTTLQFAVTPTDPLWAIRQGGVDGVVVVTEIIYN